MTLNPHLALNSVFANVWSSEAWLSKVCYSCACSECRWRT